ncbi:MAG: tetratricopeptide repeat protein [Pseudomonadota bacterium]
MKQAKMRLKFLLVFMTFQLATGFATPDPRAASGTDFDAVAKHCSESVTSFMEEKAHDGDAAAQFHLGAFYLYGICKPLNPDIGVGLLEIASGNSNPNAAFLLGELYWEGKVIERDVERAEMHLLRAASLGQAEAQFRLGTFILHRAAAKQDVESGIAWLGRAAAKKHLQSAILLGMLHQDGFNGVEADLCLAHEWFTIALDIGLENSQNVKMIMERISDTQCG